MAERVPAIAEVDVKSRKQHLEVHLEMGSYQEILFIYPLSEHPDAFEATSPQAGVYADFELETVKVEKIGDELYMCMSRLKSVKWLDEDVFDIDILDHELIESSEGKLEYFARTLP